MSADNYIAIVKEGEEYVGYDRSASADEDTYDGEYKGAERFRVKTIPEAIKAAQAEDSEYGYRFVNLEEEK